MTSQEYDNLIDRADHARYEAKHKVDAVDEYDPDDEYDPENERDVCRHGYPLDAWCDKCELGIY